MKPTIGWTKYGNTGYYGSSFMTQCYMPKRVCTFKITYENPDDPEDVEGCWQTEYRWGWVVINMGLSKKPKKADYSMRSGSTCFNFIETEFDKEPPGFPAIGTLVSPDDQAAMEFRKSFNYRENGEDRPRS